MKLVISAIFVLFTLGACNTVEGVGKDLESVGRGTQEVAK